MECTKAGDSKCVGGSTGGSTGAGGTTCKSGEWNDRGVCKCTETNFTRYLKSPLACKSISYCNQERCTSDSDSKCIGCKDGYYLSSGSCRGVIFFFFFRVTNGSSACTYKSCKTDEKLTCTSASDSTCSGGGSSGGSCSAGKFKDSDGTCVRKYPLRRLSFFFSSRFRERNSLPFFNFFSSSRFFFPVS